MACMTRVQRGARLKVAASALVHVQERVARGLVRLVAAVPERRASDGRNGCCRPKAEVHLARWAVQELTPNA